MLSYYISWHLQARLAALLFTDKRAAQAARSSPAALPVHGFRLVTTPTGLQCQALELLGVSHRLGGA